MMNLLCNKSEKRLVSSVIEHTCRTQDGVEYSSRPLGGKAIDPFQVF